MIMTAIDLSTAALYNQSGAVCELLDVVFIDSSMHQLLSNSHSETHTASADLDARPDESQFHRDKVCTLRQLIVKSHQRRKDFE